MVEGTSFVFSISAEVHTLVRDVFRRNRTALSVPSYMCHTWQTQSTVALPPFYDGRVDKDVWIGTLDRRLCLLWINRMNRVCIAAIEYDIVMEGKMFVLGLALPRCANPRGFPPTERREDLQEVSEPCWSG